MNYSRLIHQLKSKQVELDRKILADLSENDPDVMSAIVDKTKD
jgi:ribosomal protein L20